MKRIYLITTFLFCLTLQWVHGQNVMSPTDSVVTYNATADSGDLANPFVPQTGIMAKWVRSKHPRVTWNTDSFKPYIWNNMAFRLRFPKNYATDPNKKWPVMVFYHGGGEIGQIRDNEFQLLHGAQKFAQDADANRFDCFILFPQQTSVGWEDTYIGRVNNVLDTLIKYNRADPDRIISMGLSAGGFGCVNHATLSPNRVAKVISSAPAYIEFLVPDIPNIITIPHWMASGGRDPRPDTFAMRKFLEPFAALGGSMIHNYYPNDGHGVWPKQWAEPIYFTELNSTHKANPIAFFGRKDFCPDSPIVSRLALTPNFAAYEWDRNGVVIPGATNYDFFPNSYGTYRARFKRHIDSPWSAWSPNPIVVGIKSATQTPPIVVSGLRSKVLPALDGSTTVPLELQAGFSSYQWRSVLSPTVLSTDRIYTVGVGDYVGNVVEQFGCSSVASPIFKVVNAKGSNKPDRAKNVTAFAVGAGAVQVDWNKTSTPVFPTTQFEIYRATQSGGPYQLAGLNGPDQLSFTDLGLNPNTKYYYVVRAVNEMAASLTSNEAVVSTTVDSIAPTAPANLQVIFQTREYVELQWDESSDNAGVRYYDVYVNGQKTYTFDTTSTLRRIYNLAPRQHYIFTVRARDFVGNLSAPSNQVIGGTFYSGLRYRYYEGSFQTMPNFDQLGVLKIGRVDSFSIAPRIVNDFFAFVWEGHLVIPDTVPSGIYNFRMRSDDASRLYFNTHYSPTAPSIINITNATSSYTTSANIVLGPGAYQMAASFFEISGGENIFIEYRGPATNNNWRVMPSGAFAEPKTTLPTAPLAPAFLRASANGNSSINLTWIDQSNNETGFEITRSTSLTGTYSPIATTVADVTSFTDQGLLPNTDYFYRIRAIGQGGSSEFISSFIDAQWRLNQNANEAGGNTTRNLSITGTASYDLVNVQEGVSSLRFGTGFATGAQVNNSGSGGFPSNAYSTRTVGMWVRPASVTTKQMLFDFGGANFGLALRINTNGTLTAGIANNNSRATLSGPALPINTWSHVAVVYNRNNLSIFVNGVSVATTTLSFSSITTGSSSISRFGIPNSNSGSENAFNDGAAYTLFNGQMDNLFVVNTALNATELAAWMNDTYQDSHARTGLEPAAPAIPTLLSASVVSNTQINLTWTENANNESAIEVFRSTNTNTGYRLIATLPANSNSFSDTALFPNVLYFYKVRANNAGTGSNFSNEVSARTFNTAPVIKDVADFTMRFGTNWTVPIVATDIDEDDLSFTFRALPRFASFVPTGNGKGDLVLAPQMIHQGTYRFRFIVSDPSNAKDTMQFVLVVNDNHVPTINPISNVVMNEGDSVILALVSNDVETANAIKWTFDSLPVFGSFVPGSNGSGTLLIRPGYAHAGNYTVTAKVNDGLGAWSSRTFTIQVNEKSPNTKWLVNIRANSTAPAPWNNWSTNAPLTNVTNTQNQGQTLGINFVSPFNIERYAGFGVNTFNNSGYYPDAVLVDNIILSVNQDTLGIQVTGLTPNQLYNFRFMSASANISETLQARTGFRIGNRRDSVVVKNNTSQTAYMAGIPADASGQVLIRMYRSVGANTAYLNAMEIEANYTDGTLPITPQSLRGQFVFNLGNELKWKDIAYNENQYKVYRSTQRNGAYTLLNPGVFNINDTSYTDRQVLVNSTYYYYVVASNTVGDAASTDTIEIKTGNNPPVVNGLQDVYLKSGTAGLVNFSVVDDPADLVSVSVENLPGFASLMNLGGNQYRINFTPDRADIGWYYATVVATDDKGGSSQTKFRIIVSDDLVRTWLVNFAKETQKVGLPWNNISFNYPGQGFTVNNLRDDQTQPTSVGFTFVTDFLQYFEGGFVTGNNSGIVPDSVLFTGLNDFTANERTFRFTGLNPARQYSLGLVASNNSGLDARTRFSQGAQTVLADGRHNSDVQVRLNGLVPDAQGRLDINFSKELINNQYGYLNAVMLDEYDPTVTTILSPTTLRAEPLARTGIRLWWADRSHNESGGFEIYRATQLAGPYSLIQTTAANATSFVDNTVSSNIRYFYRVRAKGAGSTFSDFSNTSEVISGSGVVYVNLNSTNNNRNNSIRTLWNNTGKMPQAGDVYDKLSDDIGFGTGYTLTLLTSPSSLEPGVTAAPANSGIFPDSVLSTNYRINKGTVLSYKISGLDQTKRYRIGFSGSSVSAADLNTSMRIGDRVVFMGMAQNTQKALYIGDNVPNENGEIYVHFESDKKTGTQYGAVGALVIQAYGDEEGGTQVNSIQESGEQPILRTQADPQVDIQYVKAYPNPFVDQVFVHLSHIKPIQQVTLDLYDLQGRLLVRSNKGNLPAGNNLLTLNVSSMALPTGTYLLKLTVNNRSTGVVKLLKNQ